MIPDEPGRPCFYCEARSDVACRHRPAGAPRPPQEDAPPHGNSREARDYRGQGRNFHIRKRTNGRDGKGKYE